MGFVTSLGSFALAGALVCLLGGCQQAGKSKDIRNYYFPLKSLTDGVVYEFQPVDQDSLGPAYWYYRSILTDQGQFLTSTYYEYELLPRQHVREVMVHNGMLLEELFLYENPDSGKVQQQVPVSIVAGNVFPFSVRDSGGIFLYHVYWRFPSDPEAEYRVIKNRRYTGDTTLVVQGENLPAVKFTVRESVEYDKKGVLAQEYNGLEIYAAGVGLVYYHRDLKPGLRLAYKLADRYPMTHLEAKFSERYQLPPPQSIPPGNE